MVQKSQSIAHVLIRVGLVEVTSGIYRASRRILLRRELFS